MRHGGHENHHIANRKIKVSAGLQEMLEADWKLKDKKNQIDNKQIDNMSIGVFKTKMHINICYGITVCKRK